MVGGPSAFAVSRSERLSSDPTHRRLPRPLTAPSNSRMLSNRGPAKSVYGFRLPVYSRCITIPVSRELISVYARAFLRRRTVVIHSAIESTKTRRLVRWRIFDTFRRGGGRWRIRNLISAGFRDRHDNYFVTPSSVLFLISKRCDSSTNTILVGGV